MECFNSTVNSGRVCTVTIYNWGVTLYIFEQLDKNVLLKEAFSGMTTCLQDRSPHVHFRGGQTSREAMDKWISLTKPAWTNKTWLVLASN